MQTAAPRVRFRQLLDRMSLRFPPRIQSIVWTSVNYTGLEWLS